MSFLKTLFEEVEMPAQMGIVMVDDDMWFVEWKDTSNVVFDKKTRSAITSLNSVKKEHGLDMKDLKKFANDTFSIDLTSKKYETEEGEKRVALGPLTVGHLCMLVAEFAEHADK